MATTLPRLVRARTTIGLIQKWIKDGKLTEQSFVNASAGSKQYMTRSAILWELRAVPNNLNFPSNDPIRAVHPEFWTTVSELYGMIKITSHEYGLVEVDYNKVWSMITGPIEKEVYPTIDILIKAEQAKEREKREKREEHKDSGVEHT